MENDFDVEEIEIVLGLKNKKEELNKIISEEKGLSFLGAISKILSYGNSNSLYENIEPEVDQNEMLDCFRQKVGIDEIAKVKIQDYDKSNFANSIKGEETIPHNPNIYFSNEYIQKLKKDFAEKKEEIMKPIEVKANNKGDDNFKNKSKTFQEGKNKKYNNKENISKANNDYKRLNKNIIINTIESEKTEENKEKIQIENKENDEKKENGEKEDDKKEDNKEENNADKEKEEVKNEGNDGNEEKKEENEQENNSGGQYRSNKPHNYYNNYNNYNNHNNRRKYNKNNGTKAFREKVNSKRYK